MLKRNSILAGFLALVLLAAGCGGDDSQSSADTEKTASTVVLTKTEFIKKGDAICREGLEKIRSERQPYLEERSVRTRGAITPAIIEGFATEVVLPSIQGQAEAFEKLGIPKGDDVEVDRIIRGFQVAVEEGEEDPTVFASSDADPLKQARDAALAYGLTECPSDPKEA